MSKKPINGIRRWAALSGIAIQMGLIIYFFVQLGKWLDANYTQGNVFLIICTLFGVGLSIFGVIRQTKRLHK
jgi:F0F1-type ATP synthase assembly protein I|tara:strand:+ start:111 stop:326 length:216 start_codon:yes stop_codon:yes gene_type:complete